MLLKTIVDSLDAELGRLQALRQIVSGISNPTPVDGDMITLLQQSIPTPAGTPASHPTLLATELPNAKDTSRTGGRLRRQPEARALTATIPARPVAVPAAQVASERQRRPAARATARGAAKGKVPAETNGAGHLPSADALRRSWLAES